MKTTVLSVLALLASFSFAAPREVKKDVNIFLQESQSTKDKSFDTARLPLDRYIITSPALGPDQAIGRSYREDLSLLPKKVLTILRSEGRRIWIVEPLSGGKYSLRNEGSGTVKVAGKVFATLLDNPAPEQWVLSNVRDDLYTITLSNGSEGWFVNSELGSQVEIRPFFSDDIPPNAMFRFTSLYQDLKMSESNEKANIKIDVDIKVEEL